MKAEQRITELVEEKITGTDLFLVDVRVLPKGRIQVIVDGDKGVSIGQCAAISRHVGFHLEEENVINHAYNLEVSSPGLDMPLKFFRQYPRHIGRTLSVKLNDGNKREGKLVAVDNNELTLDETIKEKGKKAFQQETRIPFEDIKEAKVLVTFK